MKTMELFEQYSGWKTQGYWIQNKKVSVAAEDLRRDYMVQERKKSKPGYAWYSSSKIRL